LNRKRGSSFGAASLTQKSSTINVEPGVELLADRPVKLSCMKNKEKTPAKPQFRGRAKRSNHRSV
jgi:hypothetical protein